MFCLGSPRRPAFWTPLLISLCLLSVPALAEHNSYRDSSQSLTANPVAFGTVQVGSTMVQPLAVTNNGKSTVTISRVTVSGTGFLFAGPNLPISLSPRQTVTVSISFTPQTASTFSGSATVYGYVSWGSRKNSRTVMVALSGTGKGTTTNPGYLSAPSSMSLGSVNLGSTVTKTLTISNTGGTSLSISGATVSATSYLPSGMTFPYTLAAGSSANLSVSFTPTSSGTINATLYIASDASNPSVPVALTGTGTTTTTPGYLSAPSSMNLGSVNVGSTVTKTLTISNTGGTSLSISGATVNGTGYLVGGMTCPYTLAAGGSASLSVSFTPTTAGTNNASLNFTSNASNSSVAVALSGSGTSVTSGTLGVTPGSMSFGTVTIGDTQTQNGSITASGGSLTVSSASSSNSAFTLGGLTLPLTLTAGQNVSFTVTFAPKTAGATSSNIAFFTSNSTSATATANGSGATLPHTVNLSWNASTSTSVSGYNVYRGASATGPFSRINAALNPAMSYTDSTVQSGTTYYYVTTAVDSSGVESSYSNQVQAVIPFP
jgi:Abnormal spindle-like microcephaly-assoc'd, ASPM-SPD-2-Hydin